MFNYNCPHTVACPRFHIYIYLSGVHPVAACQPFALMSLQLRLEPCRSCSSSRFIAVDNYATPQLHLSLEARESNPSVRTATTITETPPTKQLCINSAYSIRMPYAYMHFIWSVCLQLLSLGTFYYSVSNKCIIWTLTALALSTIYTNILQ